MTEIWQPLLEHTLNARIVNQQRLSGGDFADSRRVTLSNDQHIFVKTHSNPPPLFFSTEAAGLTWLSETNTVAVPTVLCASDNPPCLALQWIDEGQRKQSGEAAFGRQLAALHKLPFSTFGRPDQRTTGSLGLSNHPGADWASFFRTQRLLPLAELAEARGALSSDTCQHVRWLADHLEQFAPPNAQPSLVHGDLWAGNRIVDTQGKSWIIDPAAHGNHREFDIAMMHLFGGYSNDCFAAYDEAFPLDAHWRDRIPLHQLAPLMVHAIKFGGHYAAATAEAVSRFIS